MKPQNKKVKVLENFEVVNGIYKVVVEDYSLKENKINPGQFYMLRNWKNEPILSRPISVCSVEDTKITFLYAVIGKGTESFSKLKEEDEIEIMGPLGNGFDIEKIKGNVAIVAGGIGTAPFVQVIREAKGCNIDVFAGFRSKSYAVEEMRPFARNIMVSTEDGSEGHKGYVTDLLEVEKYDLVLCCGPEIMMNKVVKMCREKNIPVYVSMEKHMACGVGACLVCTCKTKYGNKRTCKEGPVFFGDDIEL